MSSNPLNDLSKVYLDQVANVKKAETQADIQRWEDLGGPTPGNYKPLDDSAKLKESRKTKKQVRSDWRNDIFEAGDPDAVQTPGYKTSKDAARKVTEKSVKTSTKAKEITKKDKEKKPSKALKPRKKGPIKKGWWNKEES